MEHIHNYSLVTHVTKYLKKYKMYKISNFNIEYIIIDFKCMSLLFS